MTRVLLALAALVLLTVEAPSQPSVDRNPMFCSTDDGIVSRELEATCLERLKGLVSREGERLTLVLQNGKTVSFTSNSEACRDGEAGNCIVHRLMAYFPAQDFFVVDVAYYEHDQTVVVVGRRSGQQVFLEARPHLSPDGRRFVAVANSGDVREIKHDIAIYRADIDPPQFQWSYKHPGYGLFKFVRWDGDDKIKMSIEPADRSAVASRKNGHWRLDIEAARR